MMLGRIRARAAQDAHPTTSGAATAVLVRGRRQRRSIIRFFAAAVYWLLALFALTFAAVGVRSFWVVDQFGWKDLSIKGDNLHFWDVSVQSSAGGIRVGVRDWDGFRPNDPFTLKVRSFEVYPYRPEVRAEYPRGLPGRRPLFSKFGFLIDATDRRPFKIGDMVGPNATVRMFHVIVPIWALMLPGIIPLAVLARRTQRRVRHRRRQRGGLCTSCGYDLRASQSDRCPECGREAL